MGRADDPAAMEGVAYPHRAVPKASALRRMHSEAQIGSARATAPLPPPRPRDLASRAGFWNTVLDRPNPPLAPTASFHSGFSSPVGSSSSHVQPMQSFHATTPVSSMSRPLPSRVVPNKRLQCPECDASLQTSADLLVHREKHHRQSRPFQCTLCDVGFSQKSHLNQHVRTVHEKVRPHKCSQCEKAFGKKYDLSSHRDAVHGNERPHACGYCDKRFAKRSNLTRHIEKLHPEHSQQKARR